MSGPRTVRAPRGTEISCKGWLQEAALRMLMNNLDPEVAEKPDELIVYGGRGRAARNWDAFDAIVRELRAIGDETRADSGGVPAAGSAHFRLVRLEPTPSEDEQDEPDRDEQALDRHAARCAENSSASEGQATSSE